MWRGNNMHQKRKFDFEEEENKVRRNLCRLIHTLQHFPSNRSGLDTTSLWNLVEELESFNPERKTKSMQFTQTTERRSYSKKYLNLRLCPSTEQSNFSPGSYKRNRKSNIEKTEENHGDFNVHININQFKGKEFPKSKTTNHSSPSQNKSKDKILRYKADSNINKCVNKEKVTGKIFEERKINKNNYFSKKDSISENKKLKNKTKLNNQINPVKHLKKGENKGNTRREMNCDSKEVGSFNKYSSKSQTETKCSYGGVNSKSNKQNKIESLKKLNEVKVLNFKSRSHQCTPKPNKALQKIILNNSNSAVDQCSMVKKLTNYWNNLLNNEFDECSVTTESSGGPCHFAKSLEQFIKTPDSNKSDTLSENSGITGISRHLSESNINIMKRVEDLNNYSSIYSTQIPRNEFLIRTQQTEVDTTSKNKRAIGTRKEGLTPESISLVNMPLVEINNDAYHNILNKRPSSVKENIHSKQNSVKCDVPVSSEEVIEVLQQLLCTLKSFPPCDFLSDEINLPHQVKKILYLMIESISTTQNNKHHKILEMYMDQMIQVIKDSRQVVHEYLQNDIYTAEVIPVLKDKQEIIADKTFEENEDKLEEFENTCKKSSQLLKGEFLSSRSCHEDELLEVPDTSQTIDCCNKIIIKPEMALAIPGINLNKVKHALKMLMFCKEIVWAKFVSNTHGFDDFTFLNDGRSPIHSFTVICEEEVFLEEDYSDEDYDDIQNDLNLEDEYETHMDLYGSTAVMVENYIDNIINKLENYWPDSPETFITMIYQAIVTILVWWVIVKELFGK